MSDSHEFIIQNIVSKRIFDMSEVVEGDITWDSEERNGASRLSFSYMSGDMFPNGSIVRFKYKGTNIFYGYIFKTECDEKGIKKVTAYDSLRYFKYKDTKVFKGTTLDKLIREIMVGRPAMKAGVIKSTGYVLPDKIEDNKTYLDMIYDAMEDTLLATNKRYVLYDKFGTLQLVEAEELKLPIILGNESYALGFSYEVSIDGESYNRVKLAKDNKDTGVRESYIVQDSKTMAQWGVLQYYDKVSDNLNPAQIKEKAEKLLKLYNRAEKSLSIPALGDSRVRGGSGIFIDIDDRDIKINQWALVKKANHKFNGPQHTMDLELII
ncbi:TPA: hypothetical protein JRS25_003678 [Escherichia coli]|nr:hypothetical protein [Escherichia coli]HAY3976956.1 hypothetical protein [Escherichia coli]HBB9210927.1 hypothetical protein [Escherichia coli]